MGYITDGNHRVMDSIEDLQYIANTMQDYVTLDVAAVMIKPHWERQHIHKEISQGRVMMSYILIMYDEKLCTPFSKGKKMFIHKDEIERIKKYVGERKDREQQKCRWCGRVFRYCYNKPCPERFQRTDTPIQSIETVAAVYDQYIKKRTREGKSFSKVNSKGQQKQFASGTSRNIKSDNG